MDCVVECVFRDLFGGGLHDCGKAMEGEGEENSKEEGDIPSAT